MIFAVGVLVITPSGRKSDVSWVNLFWLLAAFSWWIAGTCLSVRYANSYRCPQCGQPFLKIRWGRRGEEELKRKNYSGKQASCQNCGFKVRAPKQKPKRRANNR